MDKYTGNSGEMGELLIFLRCLQPSVVIDRDSGETIRIESVGRPHRGMWSFFRGDADDPDVVYKFQRASPSQVSDLTRYTIPGFVAKVDELFALISSSPKKSSLCLPSGIVEIMDTLGIKTIKASSKDKFDLQIRLEGENKPLVVNAKSAMCSSGSLVNAGDQSVVTYRVVLKKGITPQSAILSGKPRTVCSQFNDMIPVGWRFDGLRNFSSDALRMFFDIHGYYFMNGTPRDRTDSIIREIARRIERSGLRRWKKGQIEQAFVDVSRHFACNGTASDLVSQRVRRFPPAFLYLMKNGSIVLRRIDGSDFEDYVLDHCKIDTPDVGRYNQFFTLRTDGIHQYYDAVLLVREGINPTTKRQKEGRQK